MPKKYARGHVCSCRMQASVKYTANLFFFSLAEKIRESVGGGGGEFLAAASEREGKTYDTFRVETGKYGSQGRWRKDGEKRKRCERRLCIRHFRTPVFNGSYKPAPLVSIQL